MFMVNVGIYMYPVGHVWGLLQMDIAPGDLSTKSNAI